MNENGLVLVGRESEQWLIANLLDGARSGTGGRLVFSGEPGIGKTALLESAVDSATGFRVLRAVGVESESDLPFAALSDLLRPLESHFRKLAPPQQKMLRAALALGEPMEVDRLGVGVAALAVLTSAARRRPLLVVLDDLQWFGSESHAILAFVASRLEASRVALIATTRQTGDADPRLFAPSIILPPLAHAAAEALVRASATPPIASAVVDRLVSVAAGNPLALTELPSLLDAGQLAGERGLDEPISVSASIERAFGAQVDELPSPTRDALLLASASGDAATVRAALAVTGLPPDALDCADHAGLLVVDGRRLRFRHPLLASVVYQRASGADRRAAHRALAAAETDDDRRAWHLAAAATPPDTTAATLLEATAERALRLGAAATGARALERAAELSDTRATRSRRLALAARAAHRAGDMHATSRLVAAARALTKDRAARADLLILESDIRMRGGDFTGAHARLTTEANALASVDARRAGTMLLLASKLEVYRLQAGDSLRSVERALDLLAPAKYEAVHLTALAMTRTMAGHPGARDAALAAATAARDSPHGHIHTLGIGWPLVWLEEYQAARDVVARAVAVEREQGALAYLPQALLALAELDFRTGRWAEANSAALEALSLFQDTGQPTEAAVAAAILARLAAPRGDRDACRAHAEYALTADLMSGLHVATAFAEAALGHRALAFGDARSAIESLGDALELLRAGAVGQPWLLPVHADLAEACVHAGESDRAVEVTAALERQADATGSWSAQAAVARCRGLLAGSGDFEPAFERALELHAGQPTPFERARTELCYGARLRRARRRRDARPHLQTALGLFEALGASPWADQSRTELHASGERRRPDAAFNPGLTTHEHKVARLVVQGATNREAASALFVSPKTIEYHLGNVYRKLGIRSRTELVRVFPTTSDPTPATVPIDVLGYRRE